MEEQKAVGLVMMGAAGVCLILIYAKEMLDALANARRAKGGESGNHQEHPN